MARPKKTDAPDLTKAVELTAGAIERLTCPADKQQAFLRDSKAPGLRVRATPPSAKNPQGVKAFVFEAKLNRQTIRRTIGDVRAWTIDAARAEANRLRVTLDDGTDPREVERQQAKAKVDAQAAREAAEREAEAQRKELAVYTLKNLLNDYCDHIEQLGRRSHKDARSVFRCHIAPALAHTPAKDVTLEQVADAMRVVAEKGQGRTANKLRSYIRAAYQTAILARSKASIPLKFKAYGIRHNPAADTAPDESANRTDKNPLSIAELRTYWDAIKDLPGQRGALLRLHLLTGGQRIEQLVNLLAANVRDDAIILRDGKGRPGHPPRDHTVPLIPSAAQALKDCGLCAPWALSTDGGKTHIGAVTLAAWAVTAAKAAGLADFKAKRIRSGVETALVSVRIPKEHRGHLQSHGLDGVQHRHYDGWEYFDEKREALETLEHILNRRPTKITVVQLRAA